MAKTWQVVLATVAIFIAGLVAGGATTLGVVRWIARHPRVNPAQMGGPFFPRFANGQPQALNPQLMRSFARKLDLTDDQRAKIQPILHRAVAQLTRERREVQLTSALLIEKMQDEIAEVLTPEQRAKFEDLISQQRAKLRQFKQGMQEQAPPDDAPAPK